MQDLRKLSDIPEYNNDYTKKLLIAEPYFDELYERCNRKFINKWGSYLFNGQEYKYHIDTYPKQKILFDRIKNATRVLEVGTYMGHSLLIMLLANPNLHVTCIDIDPQFAKPATDFLQEMFPSATVNFICGNSLEVLPTLTDKFDFFHIDGTHKDNMVSQEFNICTLLNMSDTMEVIFDDIDTCRNFEKSLNKTYNIVEHESPNCVWPNAYYKIQLGKE